MKEMMIKSADKRGQITIFIILAVIIVVLGMLVYIFWPQLKTTIGLAPTNPQAFIQTCIGEDLQNAVDEVSVHGGSIEPEFYYLYKDQKLEYLCYTNNNYKTCDVKRPLLISHIETEIQNNIKEKAKTCFNDLKESYEKQGYSVVIKQGPLDVELLPKRVSADFKYELTLTKESAEKYTSFEVVLNNNLYELASIAKSITDFETAYGDSETTTYMDYYPEIKVEKIKQTGGTTIYIITERDTNRKFQFASRSLAWPGGYSA